jgi:hypothetical protein
MNFNQKITHTNDRVDILQYLKEQRAANPSYTVLDIGFSANGWTRDYVTHTLDAVQHNVQNVKQFIGDANDLPVWHLVLQHVAEYGKFDFVNISHTLEDLAACTYILTMINCIGKSGFLAVPSKYAELNTQNEGGWLGYIHHHTIFDYKDDKLICYPKQSFVEHFPEFREYGIKHRDKALTELQFCWHEKLERESFMQGHLGPTSHHVIEQYKQNLLT